MNHGRMKMMNRAPQLFVLLLAATWFGLRPSALCAQQKTSSIQWEAEIAAFEAADKTNPPPQNSILFMGSSSIRLWKTLGRDFPRHPVLNRGFGGSQLVDCVNLAERIVFPYRPKQIFLYGGGNDINAGKSPVEVFGDFKAFVAKVRSQLPGTPIAYISIAPNPARWSQVERVKQANQLIEEYARTDASLKFIDVFSRMLGDDGQPRPELFIEDRLHMNAKGYELWTGVIRPYLN